MQTSKYNLKVQQLIAGISVVLFIVKIIAWYLTESVAILTDALESIVNVVAGLIGVYSLYISAKPATVIKVPSIADEMNSTLPCP